MTSETPTRHDRIWQAAVNGNVDLFDELMAAAEGGDVPTTPSGSALAVEALAEALDDLSKAEQWDTSVPLGVAMNRARDARQAVVDAASRVAGERGGDVPNRPTPADASLVQFRDPTSKEPGTVTSMTPRDAAKALLAYQVMLAEAEIERDHARGDRADDEWSDDEMQPIERALEWAGDSEMLLEHTQSWLYPNEDEPHRFDPWPDSPADCQICGCEADDGPHVAPLGVLPERMTVERLHYVADRLDGALCHAVADEVRGWAAAAAGGAVAVPPDAMPPGLAEWIHELPERLNDTLLMGEASSWSEALSGAVAVPEDRRLAPEGMTPEALRAAAALLRKVFAPRGPGDHIARADELDAWAAALGVPPAPTATGDDQP